MNVPSDNDKKNAPWLSERHVPLMKLLLLSCTELFQLKWRLPSTS